MTDTLDADARWDAAAKLASGIVDEKFRSRRRKTVAWISALIVACMLVGVAFGLWLLSNDGDETTRNDSMESRLVMQFIFLGLGLVVGIGGFIWARRSGRYITRWRAVISPLNLREKKSVRRQLAGKDPADEEHLPVLLAIAQQNQRVTQGIAPIYAALLLFNVAQSFTAPSWFIYFTLVIAVLFIVAGAQLAVAYRRTNAFIRAHTAPTQQE